MNIALQILAFLLLWIIFGVFIFMVIMLAFGSGQGLSRYTPPPRSDTARRMETQDGKAGIIGLIAFIGWGVLVSGFVWWL